MNVDKLSGILDRSAEAMCEISDAMKAREGQQFTAAVSSYVMVLLPLRAAFATSDLPIHTIKETLTRVTLLAIHASGKPASLFVSNADLLINELSSTEELISKEL